MPNIDVTNSSKFKIIIAIVFVVLMTLSTMPTSVQAFPTMSGQGGSAANALDITILDEDYYILHNGTDLHLKRNSDAVTVDSENCSVWHSNTNPYRVTKDRTAINCGNGRIAYANGSLTRIDNNYYGISSLYNNYNNPIANGFSVPDPNTGRYAMRGGMCQGGTGYIEIQLNHANGTEISTIDFRAWMTKWLLVGLSVHEDNPEYVRVFYNSWSDSVCTRNQGYGPLQYVDLNMSNTTSNGYLGTATVGSGGITSTAIPNPPSGCSGTDRARDVVERANLGIVVLKTPVYGTGCGYYLSSLSDSGSTSNFPPGWNFLGRYSSSENCSIYTDSGGFVVNGSAVSYFTPSVIDCLEDGKAIMSINNRHYSYWEDSDSDGYNDLIDPFDNDITQWSDRDGDGYGDNPAPATTPDQCPFQAGNATQNNKTGCPDNDGDGYANSDDEFPNDISQWYDTDGDRLGDNWGDTSWNISRQAHWSGQWVLNATNADRFPFDFDNDGFEDSTLSLAISPFDDCMALFGSSSIIKMGCPDTDYDGYPDTNDSFTSDPTQWSDSDDDSFGDNYGNSSWNSSRNQSWPGIWVSGAGSQDACPIISGNSTSDVYGCIDNDGDGYSVYSDYNDSDPNDWSDSDNDSVGDNSDICRFLSGNMTAPSKLGCPDSDGDNYSDDDDMFPYDPTEWNDTDYDGIGDNSDWAPIDRAESKDSDGDGVGDNSDVFPNNVNETKDSDGDGIGDNSDVFPNDSGESKDSDGDGVGDNEDDFPTNSNEFKDSDGDGIGDNSDVFDFNPDETADSDGDGIGDNADAFPNDANETLDSDKDGLGDNADNCPLESGSKFTIPTGCPDSDRDGYAQQFDLYPNNPQEWNDTDLDGIGDNSDDCVAVFGNSSEGGIIGCLDSDLDGWADEVDIWPNDAKAWSDGDEDNYTDQTKSDFSDDCPSQFGNSSIGMIGCPDLDGDGLPDLLDPDIDGDGFENSVEFRSKSDLYNSNETPPDVDGDLIADDDDDDIDGDGFPNDLEKERDTDHTDPNDTPLSQAPGTYVTINDGLSFSSSYSENGIELSVLRLRDEIKTVAGALISIIFSVFTVRRKTRRYKRVRTELEHEQDHSSLDSIRVKIDFLVEKGKIKIEQGLLLRNKFEQKEKDMYGLLNLNDEVTKSTEKELPKIKQTPTPPVSDEAPPKTATGTVGNDGYEYIKWPEDSETQWYRPVDGKAEWKIWE